MTVARRREWLLVVLVALLAAAAGYGYNLWRTAPQSAAREAVAALKDTRWRDLEGQERSLTQWRGKVIVVNFWATWCAPCREEIPIFIRLQQKYAEQGLQFVGIAIDRPEKVAPYAAEMGMNFPVLIGGADAIELTRALGNRVGALPYTIVLRRDGGVADQHLGVVREGAFDALISSLL